MSYSPLFNEVVDLNTNSILAVLNSNNIPEEYTRNQQQQMPHEHPAVHYNDGSYAANSQMPVGGMAFQPQGNMTSPYQYNPDQRYKNALRSNPYMDASTEAFQQSFGPMLGNPTLKDSLSNEFQKNFSFKIPESNNSYNSPPQTNNIYSDVALPLAPTYTLDAYDNTVQPQMFRAGSGHQNTIGYQKESFFIPMNDILPENARQMTDKGMKLFDTVGFIFILIRLSRCRSQISFSTNQFSDSSQH